MSLVNEAAVDAADLALAARGVWVAKKFVRAALEAAEPHMAPLIGAEAIRQAVGETRYQHVRQGAIDHSYVRALDDVLKHAEGER